MPANAGIFLHRRNTIKGTKHLWPRSQVFGTKTHHCKATSTQQVTPGGTLINAELLLISRGGKQPPIMHTALPESNELSPSSDITLNLASHKAVRQAATPWYRVAMLQRLCTAYGILSQSSSPRRVGPQRSVWVGNQTKGPGMAHIRGRSQ